MKIFAFLFLLPLCLISGLAQTSPSQCPTVRVTSPDAVEAGGKLMFSALVQGGDKNVTPTYNWTVSAGTISSGQGTSTIEMDLTGVAGDSTVTATVDVGGYERTCATSASSTTSVLKKVEAREFDEYGAIPAIDENARLDNFALELTSDPTAQGYLLAYGGRSTRAQEAQKAAGRAKQYLVKKRGVDAQRVVVVDGGYREQMMMELWLAPAGALPPKAAPTVDPSEVKPSVPAKPMKAKTNTYRKR